MPTVDIQTEPIPYEDAQRIEAVRITLNGKLKALANRFKQDRFLVNEDGIRYDIEVLPYFGEYKITVEVCDEDVREKNTAYEYWEFSTERELEHWIQQQHVRFFEKS